jgi:hypothetical protein
MTSLSRSASRAVSVAWLGLAHAITVPAAGTAHWGPRRRVRRAARAPNGDTPSLASGGRWRQAATR